MSQKEKANPIGFEISESSTGDLSTLAELARQAYERRDKKKCLDLTRSILLIDPDNADAQRMRSSIQSDIQRDLQNARAFLRPMHSKDNSEPHSPPSGPAAPTPDSKLESGAAHFEPAVVPEVRPRRWLLAGAIVAFLGIAIGGLYFGWPLLRTLSNPIEAPKPAIPAAPQIAEMNASRPEESDLMPVPPPTALPPATPSPIVASAASPASRPAAKVPETAAIPAASGILAISSPTTVDIYKDGSYVGSVPVSLELPAGTHTLEYRHGDLSRTVSHVVNGNETTKAMITFDVNVRINSRPWAEVFVDGVERKSLGQTPLSGVRIPIGTVLIFENRQFPTRKYRVTGNETGIQNVFP